MQDLWISFHSYITAATFVPHRSCARYSRIPIRTTSPFNPELHSPSVHRWAESEILWLIGKVLLTKYLFWHLISWSFYFVFFLLRSQGFGVTHLVSTQECLAFIFCLWSLLGCIMAREFWVNSHTSYSCLWTTWKFSFCFWACPLDLPGMQRFLFYSGCGAHIRSTNGIGLLVSLISGTRNVGVCYFWLLRAYTINWSTLAIYIRMQVLNVKWRLANKIKRRKRRRGLEHAWKCLEEKEGAGSFTYLVVYFNCLTHFSITKVWRTHNYQGCSKNMLEIKEHI